MSHKIEELQRMTDDQLLNIARHSQWQFDRENANRILQERRRRSRDFEARTQNLVNSLQTQVNNLTRTNGQLASQVQAAQNQVSQMQRTHTQQMNQVRSDFDNRLREADRNHREQLTHLARQTQQGIREARQELRQYIDTGLAHNMELMNRQITQTRSDLQAAIQATADDLQNQINGIHTEIDSIRNIINATRYTQNEMLQQARDYQSAALAVLNAVDAFNVHGWLREDRAALERTSNRLARNLQYGNEAASVAMDNGLNLFQEALVFQQNVIAEERQWQLRMTIADEAVSEAETVLELSRKKPVKTSEGEIEVDIDYWTCGDLRRIEAGLAEIRSRMEDPNLTVEQLEALQELALSYRGQILQSVNYALQAFQLSRGRRQLMDNAITALSDPRLGFNLTHQWSEYFNNDPRLGYRAYLVNQNGVRVVITAELTNEGSANPNNLFRSEILDFGSQVYNADQAEQYNNELLAALQRNTNVEFGQPRCTSRDSVVPDEGQSIQTGWSHPDQARVDQAVNQVGYQIPHEVQTQIQNQRVSAGMG